jgi:hypothetical protein
LATHAAMTIVEDDQSVFQRSAASSIASLGFAGHSGLTLQLHQYRPVSADASDKRQNG